MEKSQRIRSGWKYAVLLLYAETRQRSTIDVEDWAATSAATPPYEAFPLQLRLVVTGPSSDVEGDDDVLVLLDVSRAHLHSPLARVVVVTNKGKVYKLLKAMYGLRDRSVTGQVQHLCWIQEGDEHVGQVGALG